MNSPYKRTFLQSQLQAMEEDYAQLKAQVDQTADAAQRERGIELLRAAGLDLHNLRADMARLQENENEKGETP